MGCRDCTSVLYEYRTLERGVGVVGWFVLAAVWMMAPGMVGAACGPVLCGSARGGWLKEVQEPSVVVGSVGPYLNKNANLN